MDFNNYAVNYLNKKYNTMNSNFLSASFKKLNTIDVKEIFFDENLNHNARNHIACNIIENHELKSHVFKEIVQCYFLEKESVIKYDFSDLEVVFESTFKNKYEKKIDLTEKKSFNVLKFFPLLSKNSQDVLSVKNISPLNGLNINDVVSNDYDVVDLMLDIVKIKKEHKKKTDEINHLLYIFLDFFTQQSFSQNDIVEEKIKKGFSKIFQSAKNNGFDNLIENIDFNFICGDSDDNTKFSELEIALIDYSKSDKLIKKMYQKKRQWILSEDANGVILRYSASIDLDDYSYIELLLKDIESQNFKKGTRFWISDVLNQDVLINYNVVEKLINNGYYIDSLCQKHLINTDNKKDLFFKIMHDSECNKELCNILNPKDFFWIFSIDSILKNGHKKVFDFILENKEIIFDNDINITKEGQELIELNFSF